MYIFPYHNQLDTVSFKNMLDTKNIHNSYKIFWLKSIIHHVENDEQVIPFSSIVFDMFKNSYDFINKYHLKFGGSDVIPRVIMSYNTQSKNDFLFQLKENDFDKLIKDITAFVPYRLLTPFYQTHLVGKKDILKHDIIIEKSMNDTLAFYTINRKESSIFINEAWMSYIKDNIGIIKAWIDHELVHFLQRRNPSIPNIPFKVNPQTSRNLVKAKKIWDEAISINPALNFDLFSNKIFTKESTTIHGPLSIDHFLPWSFVAHDQLWNLIPTHRNINSSKNNNLPSEQLIDPYIEIQYDFYVTIHGFASRAIIEEYHTLMSNVPLDNNVMDRSHFYNMLYDNTHSLYKIAKNNGYSIWQYNE